MRRSTQLLLLLFGLALSDRFKDPVLPASSSANSLGTNRDEVGSVRPGAATSSERVINENGARKNKSQRRAYSRRSDGVQPLAALSGTKKVGLGRDSLAGQEGPNVVDDDVDVKRARAGKRKRQDLVTSTTTAQSSFDGRVALRTDEEGQDEGARAETTKRSRRTKPEQSTSDGVNESPVDTPISRHEWLDTLLDITTTNTGFIFYDPEVDIDKLPLSSYMFDELVDRIWSIPTEHLVMNLTISEVTEVFANATSHKLLAWYHKLLSAPSNIDPGFAQNFAMYSQQNSEQLPYLILKTERRVLQKQVAMLKHTSRRFPLKKDVKIRILHDILRANPRRG